MATVVFCSDPTRRSRPDPDYAAEAAAAAASGFRVDLVDHDALLRGDVAGALEQVTKRASADNALFRGWMMPPSAYAKLRVELEGRGMRLVNDEAAYKHTHWLPESYSLLRGRTPETIWIRDRSPAMETVRALLAPFGDRPILVKDFVKSRKHEWLEACFIPHASDKAAVEKAVRRFLELQGDELAEGLVFREYVELETIGTHPQSGMPLACEHRFFVLRGKPVLASAYWEHGDAGAPPPFESFADLVGRVQSSFFTLDVAKRVDGDWIVIELGDGGVAGLPARADPAEFYRALFAGLG